VELLGENVRKEEKSARNIDQLKEINLFHPRLGSAAFVFNITFIFHLRLVMRAS
jgi:hypothetical protein